MMNYRRVSGKLGISRTSSNIGEDYINIEVKDEKSGVRVVTCQVALADFAEAVTGVFGVPMEMKVAEDVSKVGKRKEVATFHIPNPEGSKGGEVAFYDRMTERAKEFEIDGWKYEHRPHNSRRQSPQKYAGLFLRYVDEE
jgi:hypothetical protein